MQRARKAKKAAAKPKPEPVAEAVEPEPAKAPARTKAPDPEPEPIVDEGDFDVDVFVEEAFTACADVIEKGGGLNPGLPGSAFPTKGYKLIPNLESVAYKELAARIKKGEKDTPPMPEVQSIVFYLKNGQRARHRRTRVRYNPDEES